MTTSENFWSNPKHKMLADMLQKQSAVEQQLDHVATYPWHRVIYMKASAILSKMGARPTYELRHVPEARQDLLDIWAAGLSWSIKRFGLVLEGPQFESLVQAVARRVTIAQSKPLLGENVLEQLGSGVDGLVERAGRGLFSFDHFTMIAHALDYDELHVLHQEFMRRA